jgi:hypothetical protein
MISLVFGVGPLENDVGRKTMVISQLEDFAFINGRGLKQFWVTSGHGSRRQSSREMGAWRRRKKENGGSKS